MRGDELVRMTPYKHGKANRESATFRARQNLCGADINFAWPTAKIAVMGPEAAVNAVFLRGKGGLVRLPELDDHVIAVGYG